MRAAALLLAILLAGCADSFGLFRPDYSVAITPLVAGDTAWNRQGTFEVQVAQPGVPVHIEALSTRGDLRSADGVSQANLTLPDGTWSVTYRVGGYDWGVLDPVRIDGTPPDVDGLALVGQAPSGTYELGVGAHIEGAQSVQVLDIDTGTVVGSRLPVQLAGLSPGLHLYRVAARDAAGNWANTTVQVLSGSNTDLPAGKTDFGVVARYNNAARLWDLRDLGRYQSPAAAAQAQPGYLGTGFGITPGHPAVQQVVAAAAPAGGTTGEVAVALYRWMFDHLDYDKARLNQTGLLQPAETLQAGGGVCRDLAALYVSLLRGAGVPARLVTGYVAGSVDGFHAWVEFYGAPADAPAPWVPVDVSPIDGPFSDTQFLGSFGVQLPEYLMLRQLPPTAETEGWFAAGSLGYQWPQGRPEPDVRFEDSVTDDRTVPGVLCLNSQTRLRRIVDPGPPDNPGKNCPPHPATDRYLPGFVAATERTIDYGITIQSAPSGTSVDAQVAYPFDDRSSDDTVEYLFHGPNPVRDEATGKAKATLTR